MSYYESALQRDGQEASFTLRHDLAELYKRLKQYDNATRVITEKLNQSAGKFLETLYIVCCAIIDGLIWFPGDGIDEMKERVKLYTLLAQVQKLNSMPDKSCSSLLRARELQNSYVLSKAVYVI